MRGIAGELKALGGRRLSRAPLGTGSRRREHEDAEAEDTQRRCQMPTIWKLHRAPPLYSRKIYSPPHSLSRSRRKIPLSRTSRGGSSDLSPPPTPWLRLESHRIPSGARTPGGGGNNEPRRSRRSAIVSCFRPSTGCDDLVPVVELGSQARVCSSLADGAPDHLAHRVRRFLHLTCQCPDLEPGALNSHDGEDLPRPHHLPASQTRPEFVHGGSDGRMIALWPLQRYFAGSPKPD